MSSGRTKRPATTTTTAIVCVCCSISMQCVYVCCFAWRSEGVEIEKRGREEQKGAIEGEIATKYLNSGRRERRRNQPNPSSPLSEALWRPPRSTQELNARAAWVLTGPLRASGCLPILLRLATTEGHDTPPRRGGSKLPFSTHVLRTLMLSGV